MKRNKLKIFIILILIIAFCAGSFKYGQITMEPYITDAYKRGTAHGYSNGYEKGYDLGYTAADGDYSKGYDQGYTDGYNDGFDEWFNAGYESGYSDGQTKTSNSYSDVPGAGVLVYITDTGSKYHLIRCQYLSESKIPVTLAFAKQNGYGPCSVCNPPR